jgi:predicted kinase
MELIVLSGAQGAGKTTFYKWRYSGYHHLSMDVLRSRTSEDQSLREMLAARVPLVVDNTNPTIESRIDYIVAGKDAGYRIIGCQLKVSFARAMAQNQMRVARVPTKVLKDTFDRIKPMRYNEGFDEIFIVVPGPSLTFQMRLLPK